MARTIVYIDGFNLYYRALRGTAHKWLDIAAMSAASLPASCQIERINYYTAHISALVPSTGNCLRCTRPKPPPCPRAMVRKRGNSAHPRFGRWVPRIDTRLNRTAMRPKIGFGLGALNAVGRARLSD